MVHRIPPVSELRDGGVGEPDLPDTPRPAPLVRHGQLPELDLAARFHRELGDQELLHRQAAGQPDPQRIVAGAHTADLKAIPLRGDVSPERVIETLQVERPLEHPAAESAERLRCADGLLGRLGQLLAAVARALTS